MINLLQSLAVSLLSFVAVFTGSFHHSPQLQTSAVLVATTSQEVKVTAIPPIFKESTKTNTQTTSDTLKSEPLTLPTKSESVENAQFSTSVSSEGSTSPSSESIATTSDFTQSSTTSKWTVVGKTRDGRDVYLGTGYFVIDSTTGCQWSVYRTSNGFSAGQIITYCPKTNK